MVLVWYINVGGVRACSGSSCESFTRHGSSAEDGWDGNG